MRIFLALLVCGALAYAFRVWRARRNRKRLLASELTDDQRAIVEASVPIVRKLPAELRRKLEGRICLFLNQIRFIGCDGLDVTEEMRLSIAAQACLLVANTDRWYETLYTILIYPGAFRSMRKEYDGYVVRERDQARLGESWARGPVVLSWSDAQQGALDDRDGHNVVFHEFAHQIDNLSGHTDGTPILDSRKSYAEWANTFEAAFRRHIRSVETGRETVIDPYGAEGPQEFFAVSVELFFEKPAALKREEPEVYRQLANLFRLDPSAWT